MIAIICIVIWVVCAILSAGIEFAYWQGKYPEIAKDEYQEDLGVSLLRGMTMGPISLIMIFFLTGFCKYGWRLK